VNVKKISEHGYHEALLGMALSYYHEGEDLDGWIASRDNDKLAKTGAALVRKGPDHGKWIRAIQTWWMITAPRFWWSEMDTYKVGTVALSASTMHTLTKGPLTPAHFESWGEVAKVDLSLINALIDAQARIDLIKSILPEGYLQTRLWVANYQTLRTVIEQRDGHRLPQWALFREAVLKQADHPELLK
jgi:predicted phage gp36 major capsid-like protein